MTERHASLLAPLPYFAAFVAAPLALLADRLSGGAGHFQGFGPHGLALWLCLSGLAVLVSLGRLSQQRARLDKSMWPAAGLGLILCVVGWVLARQLALRLGPAVELAPLLDELRLPVLALFAGLWAWSFGAPKRSSLAHAGAILGALAVLDFLLTAIMARSLVLGGGYLFGDAPGTADTLAFLLCLALCATFDDLPEPGVPRLARWLTLAGLLSTFSQAGIVAGALACLLLDRGPVRERLSLALACSLAVWMTLYLPLPHLAGGDSLGLAWHYGATMEALGEHPNGFLVGLPLDAPMALAMPDFQGLIWDGESEGLPVSVFEIPSSGLRLLAAWGLGAPLAALGAALLCAVRGRMRFGFGLFIVLIVGGALSPALHTPATAASLALALASASRPRPHAAEPDRAAA